MSKSRNLTLCSALALLVASPGFAQGLGLGRTALPEEILAWDTVVLPDGTGLRPGSGSVEDGEEVFVANCAACHGDFAEGLDSWPPLAGGWGSLTDARPLKTVGSYWPYLSTLWDYTHRSMPFGAAQVLTVDEVYAITAYLLYSNNLVDDDFVLTDANFTEIRLPNEEGFYPDDRDETEVPLFSVAPCMSDCGAEVAITRRAVDLGVTPMDAPGTPAGTLPDLELASLTLDDATDAAQAAPEPEPEPEIVVATLDPAMVAAGQRAFRQCQSCHNVGDNARNGTGPQLNAIVGAVAGQVDGFRYSNPMRDAGAGGLIWTADALDAFLTDPRGYMAGNRMSFRGIRNADERAAVIAYLTSLGE